MKGTHEAGLMTPVLMRYCDVGSRSNWAVQVIQVGTNVGVHVGTNGA